jgi:hypothetical protein
MDNEEWMLLRDNNDGELRVVVESEVKDYLENNDYTGSWEIVMRDKPLEELKAYCRLAHGSAHEKLSYNKSAWIFTGD